MRPRATLHTDGHCTALAGSRPRLALRALLGAVQPLEAVREALATGHQQTPPKPRATQMILRASWPAVPHGNRPRIRTAPRAWQAPRPPLRLTGSKRAPLRPAHWPPRYARLTPRNRPV